MSNQTYSESALYDLAFSYRNYPEEVATLIHWFKDIRESNHSPRSALELAAGPGRHSIELSRRGVSTVALDLSKEMSNYCSEIALEQNAVVETLTADMTSFELNKEFDMILILINSICHILKDEALLLHFESVARHLSSTGIYIIEATREPLEALPGRSDWRQQSATDQVEISWRWDNQSDYVQMEGKISGQTVAVDDQFPMRRWRTRELFDLATEAGLKLVGHSGRLEDDYIDEIGSTKNLVNTTTMHSCLVFGK